MCIFGIISCADVVDIIEDVVGSASQQDQVGNDRSSAAVLELSEKSRATKIDAVDDIDYFSVDIPSSGTLRVYSTGEIDVDGDLYGTDETPLASDDNSGTGNNFDISHFINNPGTYFIKVSGDGTNTGDYMVHIKFTDDHGDTREDATAIILGTEKRGNLSPSDDDYFAVTISASGTHKLVVLTKGVNIDTLGELQNSAGTMVASDDNSGSGNHFKITQSVAAGTYYIRVYGGSGVSGAYTLSVTVERSTATSENTRSVSFPFEAINTNVQPHLNNIGYNPPAIMAFDTRNRPYMYNSDQEEFIVQTIRNSKAVNINFESAMKSFFGSGATLDINDALRSCMTIDNDNRFYMTLKVLVTNWKAPNPDVVLSTQYDQGRARQNNTWHVTGMGDNKRVEVSHPGLPILIYSRDITAASPQFDFFLFTEKTWLACVEQQKLNSVRDLPPPIIFQRDPQPSPPRAAKPVHIKEVYFPTISTATSTAGDLILGDSVIITQKYDSAKDEIIYTHDANIMALHSGGRNTIVTRKKIGSDTEYETFIVWNSLQRVRGPNVMTVSRFDRSNPQGYPTAAGSSRIEIGGTPPGGSFGNAEDHANPELNIDSQGVLHVVANAQHREFWYSQSNVAATTWEPFTAFLLSRRRTYPQMQIGKDDKLHLFSRSRKTILPEDGVVTHGRGKLKYERFLLQSDNPTTRDLTHNIVWLSRAPSRPPYVVFYQRAFVDLDGILYISSQMYHDSPNSLHKRLMYVSEDNGTTWSIPKAAYFITRERPASTN